MPTPLDNALRRLAELQREEAEINRFIEMYHRFGESQSDGQSAPVADDDASQLRGNNTSEKDTQTVDNSPTTGARKPRRQGAAPKEIAELMERVIREADRPLSRGEIVDALERRDIEINAQDKSRYVGTIAWRNKGKFINIEGRGYWLRDAIQRAPGVSPGTPYFDPPEEASDELPLD